MTYEERRYNVIGVNLEDIESDKSSADGDTASSSLNDADYNIEVVFHKQETNRETNRESSNWEHEDKSLKYLKEWEKAIKANRIRGKIFRHLDKRRKGFIVEEDFSGMDQVIRDKCVENGLMVEQVCLVEDKKKNKNTPMVFDVVTAIKHDAFEFVD